MQNTVLLTPLVVFFLFSLLPFVIMLSGSLSSDDMLLEKGLSLFPRGLSFEGYKMLFMFPDDIINSYMLTIGVAVVGTALNIFLCLLLAFVLSDTDYRYRRLISFVLYFTILFSPGIIPVYIIVRRYLMLYDTFWILVLFPLLGPGTIFTLRVYLQSLPSSIFESVRVDGASEFRILWQIAVPLVKPGISIVAFTVVLGYWNDANTALLFTDKMVPIARYMSRWQNFIEFLKMVQQGLLPGMTIDPDMPIPTNTVRYAIGVITSLPLIIIFLFFQRQFVNSLIAGAIKG